jgi:hypothetical protein
MDDAKLPRHVLDKVERRWASRLARDAASWRSEKSIVPDRSAVVDRAGRVIPVTVRRAPAPLPRTA